MRESLLPCKHEQSPSFRMEEDGPTQTKYIDISSAPRKTSNSPRTTGSKKRFGDPGECMWILVILIGIMLLSLTAHSFSNSADMDVLSKNQKILQDNQMQMRRDFGYDK